MRYAQLRLVFSFETGRCAMEIKISDSCDVNDDDVLKRAIEVYKQNKDRF
jgi:hypothetical protein